MTRSSAIGVLFALAVRSTWGYPSAPQAVPAALLPQTRLTLPPGAKLQQVVMFRDAASGDCAFGIDEAEAPWLSCATGTIADPFSNRRFELPEAPGGFVWIGARRLATATDASLRVLELSTGAPAGGIARIAASKDLGRLPYRSLRLLPAGKNGFYVQGRSPTDGRNVLLLAVSRPGEERIELRPLMSVPEPIAAAAGDGRDNFFAVGDLVFRVDPSTGKRSLVVRVSEKIVDLAYMPGTGLFYATTSGIGFASRPPRQFVRGLTGKIRAGGKDLYILSKEGLLARLENAASFRAIAKEGIEPALRDEEALPTGVSLAVPRGVTVAWTLPPGAEKRDRRPEVVDFAVDRDGRPWLDLGRRVLAAPTTGVAFLTDAPVNGLVWMPSGLLVHSGNALGTLQPSSQSKEMIFKERLALPRSDFKLYPDANGGLYLTHSAGRESEVFWFHWDSRGDLEAKKIASFRGDVHSVAGNGRTTFVAVSSSVVKICGREPVVYMTHPAGTVQDLAYDPRAGLFYATASGVGFGEPRGLVEFIRAPRCRIRIRNGSLYVLLEESRGVLKFTGIESFNRVGGGR